MITEAEFFGPGRRTTVLRDEALIEFLEAALAGGPLGQTRLGSFASYAIRLRLARGLSGERQTLEKLTTRYHIALPDLLAMVATIAMRWHEGRPLADDAAWPCPKSHVTAPELRQRLPALRTSGDLLRDLHSFFAVEFDAWTKRLVADGWTPSQARELTAHMVVDNSILGLGPKATENEIAARMSNVSDVEWTLGSAADLFAHDVLTTLDGRTLIQVAVLALRFVETIIQGTEGRLATGRGRPRVLDLVREGGRELTAFFRDQTGKPLTGHAAALLAAACPTPTLARRRERALRSARETLPLRVQERLDPSEPDRLPPRAHTVYLDKLSSYLERDMRR